MKMSELDRIVLSADQKQFYREYGYLHVKNCVDEATLVTLIAESESHAQGLYTNYLDMHTEPTFASLHRGGAPLQLADQIMTVFGGEERAIPVGSTWFYCPPKGASQEYGSTWHQDNYAGMAPMHSYLNIGLALDDADASNGALMVVPGSHLLGDLPCNPKANFGRDDAGRLVTVAPIGNDCELPENLPIVQLEYKAGDLLAIHAHLVHKAERNLHPTRWRRTMYFVYNRDKTPFWPGWTAKRTLLDREDFQRC